MAEWIDNRADIVRRDKFVQFDSSRLPVDFDLRHLRDKGSGRPFARYFELDTDLHRRPAALDDIAQRNRLAIAAARKFAGFVIHLIICTAEQLRRERNELAAQ